jgi:hypothetical protein
MFKKASLRMGREPDEFVAKSRLAVGDCDGFTKVLTVTELVD